MSTASPDRPTRRGLPRPRRRAVPPDGRMTLVEHLYELRSRVGKSLVVVLIASIVAYVFFDRIFHVIRSPYCDLPPHVRGQAPGTVGCQLYVFGVLAQFML